jgi:tryptophan-rich sensory protein
LQAASASQQPQKPTHVLSWIIHHPIQWIRGLDEWKHFSSLINLRKNGNQSESRRRRWRAFNPDPLLFPATWMPLRWLQIYVIARAFATDPGQYRWCSAEKQTVIVHRLMNVYLVQLALGDEWSRVFLGEYRVGLGILVVSFYFLGKAVCYIDLYI